MVENPYEAPQTFDAPLAQTTDAEIIRREHIKTEASIKSIGILYYLGGVGLLFAGAVTLTSAQGASAEARFTGPLIGGLLVILGILYFMIGAAVRKLKPWSRIGVGILSGIGLLGIPIGTLINAYILFLVFGKKGQMVFSDPYKEIIAATPHVKYKTSKVVWIVLGIVVAIIALAIVAASQGH